MKLLDSLIKVVESQQLQGIVTHDGRVARLVHFAFTDDGQTAFLSEIETEELVPLLEQWCAARRAEMGIVQ